MTLQLIGSAKSKDTQKAQRWLKERRIEFHFLDVGVKPLAAGEIDHLAQALGGYDNLLDPQSKTWQKRGLAYLEYSAREELLASSELLKLPILRAGKQALLGFTATSYAAFWAQVAGQ